MLGVAYSTRLKKFILLELGIIEIDREVENIIELKSCNCNTYSFAKVAPRPC